MLAKMPRKGYIWDYFTTYMTDKYVFCNTSNEKVSCGSMDPRKQLTMTMNWHLDKKHPMKVSIANESKC